MTRKPLRFTKMQGIGNDYVYIDLIEQGESVLPDPYDRGELVRTMSDRRFGAGGDGVIFIEPASPGVQADCKMRMFNADGSEGRMCGNGLRCVALFMFERRRFSETLLRVETLAGIKLVSPVRDASGNILALRADMDKPGLTAASIPTTASDPSHISIKNANGTYTLFGVSMGSPHAVTLVKDPAALDLEKIGPALETDPIFPDRANIEFIRVDQGEITMRVWERGSGETWACGTGACASAVAAISQGLLPREKPVTVHLRGGDLTIEWDKATDRVYMTGPAAFVYDGLWLN